MLIQFCKSKIAYARVTEAQLHYQGSITLDEDLMKAVDLIPGEKVELLNINNGTRIETYCILGKPGSGEVCLNGPAARCGVVGDELIILAYCLAEPDEAKKLKTKIVYLDEKNRIKS